MSSKISLLTDGVTADATDRLPVARSPFAPSDNRYVTTDYLADYIALITIAEVFSGALQVEAATTAVLAGSPTYANGAAGVGATLTKGSNGAFPSQDGVASVVGNRYLVKNQAAALQNGVYELTTLGTAGTPWVLTRTTDSDLNTELDAQIVIPGAGTVNKRFVFNQTTPLPTIGTSNIVYAQTAATAGLGIPLTRTVAQMQALAAASGFNTGRSYIISNIQVANCTCSAMFTALSTSTISTTGNGTFLNAAMSVAVAVTIEYTLATDLISSIYVPVSNVLATSHFNLAAITSFPYDSATINDGVIHDPQLINVHTNALLVGFHLMGYNNITMSSGSTFKGQLGLESQIDLAGTAEFTGTVGILSNIVMLGTQSLTNCTIGDGKTLDLTSIDSAYTAVGKVWIGNISTFVCAQGKDLTGLVTPLLLNDFLGGGEDYSFCGEFTGFTNGGLGGPFAIDTIQPFTIAHKFVLRHSSLLAAGAYVGGGNLRIATIYSPCAMALSSDAVGFTLDPLTGEYITTGDTFIQ